MKNIKEGDLIYIPEMDVYGKAAFVDNEGRVISAYVDTGKGERIVNVIYMVVQAVTLLEKIILAIKKLFK